MRSEFKITTIFFGLRIWRNSQSYAFTMREDTVYALNSNAFMSRLIGLNEYQ